jgi:hypothetical protein
MRIPDTFSKSLKVDVERRSFVNFVNPQTREPVSGDFLYRADPCSWVAFWYQRTVAGQKNKWPYVEGGRVPRDPWDQPYQYRVPGRHHPNAFDIWSIHGESRNPSLWIGNWSADRKE